MTLHIQQTPAMSHAFQLKVKGDTGAKCNVMSLHVCEQMMTQDLINRGQRAKLRGFAGNTVLSLGTITLHSAAEKKGRKIPVSFQVLDKPDQTLIGLKDCLDMWLIALGKQVYTVEEVSAKDFTRDMITKYAELFDNDVGCLPTVHKITLKPNVTPIIRPVRCIPLAIKDLLKKKLDRMCEQNIIEPITEPTDWVSAMVVENKNHLGNIHICIDPGDLNKAIKRQHSPLR